MKEVDESRELPLSFDELADKALEIVKEKLEDIKNLENLSEEDRPIVEDVAREASEGKVLQAVKIIVNECNPISEEFVKGLAKVAHGAVTAFVTSALTPIVSIPVASIAGEVAGRAVEAGVLAVGESVRESLEGIASDTLSTSSSRELQLEPEL